MDDILVTLTPWLKPLLVFAFFTLVRYLYRTVILRVLHQFNNKSSFEYGADLLDAFERPVHFFLFIFAIYAGLNISPLTFIADHPSVDQLLRSFFIICFIWGFYNLSDTTHGIAMRVLLKAGIEFDLALSNVVSTTLRILLVILGFVMIAKEWNYDITGFIASLSIGSLAVALAAKDSLANVFGSLVIIIDKPFIIGDWISANGIEGTVEKITFRSTCLRTFPQELVYIPNSLLSNTAITNFTKREKRRVDFILGLTYSTTYQQMQAFVQRLRDYLLHNEDVFDEGILVTFQDFGGSSLDIRVVCYTKTSTSAEFMSVRQQINLDIMKMLDEDGLGCAFPSTSVYFETPIVQKNEAKEGN